MTDLDSSYSSDHSLQKVCRLCLSDESLEDIFDQENMSVWVSDFLSIVVSRNDTISRWICDLCRIRLQEFQAYQSRCIEVQEVLLSESPAIDDKTSSLRAVDDVHSFSTLKTPQISKPTLSHKVQYQNYKDSTKGHTKPGQKRGYTGQHIVCNICGKKIQKLRFEDHLNGHLGRKPYKCERGCEDEQFTCKYKRQTHYRKVHEGFLYRCKVCELTFGAKQGLYSHTQRHHVARTYICRVCNEEFSTEYLRRRHYKVHKGEKTPTSAVSSLSTNSTDPKRMSSKSVGD